MVVLVFPFLVQFTPFGNLKLILFIINNLLIHIFLFFLSKLLDLLRFISLFFIFIGFVNLQRSFYLIFESILNWLHFHHQWLTTKIYLKILILSILSYYLFLCRFYIFLFQDVHIEFWYCNSLKQEITDIFGAFSWVLNQ